METAGRRLIEEQIRSLRDHLCCFARRNETAKHSEMRRKEATGNFGVPVDPLLECRPWNYQTLVATILPQQAVAPKAAVLHPLVLSDSMVPPPTVFPRQQIPGWDVPGGWSRA